MDTKANLNNRKKINELAIQHNKLTTLVGCLLNEITSLKKEISYLKGPNSSLDLSHQKQPIQQTQQNQQNHHQQNPNKFPNFSDLRAEDILKQLSINTLSN